MPTYSYKCQQCDTAFDIQQAFTDDSLTVCPNCGGKLRKVFGAVGVSFTGSGFYRNDSRAAETTPGAKTDSKAAGSKAGDSKAADSKPSESKPAETSTPKAAPSGASSGVTS